MGRDGWVILEIKKKSKVIYHVMAEFHKLL